MGGSISPATIWTIIEKNKSYHVASSLEHAIGRMVCTNNSIRSFSVFLDKFRILDEVKWDEWAIDLACRQIIADTKAQGTSCIDISFSVDKYVRSGMWSYADAIKFICDSYNKYGQEYGVSVGAFLSISYHSPREKQIEVACLVKDAQVVERVIGLDLVGDERYYNDKFHGNIIEAWNNANKVTREHLAEIPGTSNNLISLLDRPSKARPKRIAHGIQGSLTDMAKAADCGIYFDLAINSNLYTGAVDDIKKHPISAMLNAGCLVTLNTDDPIQFNCTLDDEFTIALSNGLIDEYSAEIIQKNAVDSLR